MILYLKHQLAYKHFHFSAKEKRLIYNSGDNGGGDSSDIHLTNIASPQPDVRVSKVLSNKDAAMNHINKMRKAASLEMQRPVKEITDGISEAVKKILSLPGAVWKGAKKIVGGAATLVVSPIAAGGALATNTLSESGKFATKVTGGTLGAIANIPRWGWDATVSLAGKIPTVVGDITGKALGYPSRMIRSGTEKTMKGLESAKDKVMTIGRNIRDRAMKIIGAEGDHGGPGGHEALAPAH